VMMRGASHPEPMKTSYSKPAIKLLAEYHVTHSPPAAFTWLNLYLERIMTKTFSVDNLLHKFVSPGRRDMDFSLSPYWMAFTSLVGSMSDMSIIACGLAVIAPLKLFVLQPWSYTSMFCPVNIDFGFGAVERLCTIHPLVNTIHSMISWLRSPMSL